MRHNFNNFIDVDVFQPNKLNTNKTDDDEICIIKFANCHNKYPLEKLNSKELKSFIDFCKKIEKMTWKEIKIDEGLNYETPKYFKVSMPDLFPKDATALSFRVTKKFRIIDWREKQYLNLMWLIKIMSLILVKKIEVYIKINYKTISKVTGKTIEEIKEIENSMEVE